jgi:hypothetical protein
MPADTLTLTKENLEGQIALARREAAAERDRVWQRRVDNAKLLIREAVKIHLPQDRDRDARLTRFVNALYAGIVRTLGPL